MARKGENIYKRKDGRWEARYIFSYNSDGKAKYKYLYARTYSEVKAKLIRGQNSIEIKTVAEKVTDREKYEFWLNNVKDKKMLEELKSMNENEIQLAFFKDIAFETAGLRGIVGAGSNCMNIYTVGRVAKAISIYMQKIGGKKIAISYDSRNMSYEFANLSARIFASYGIKVYLAKKLMPTPFLSYMVRFYKCDMGVNVTASHNPKDYNG